MIKNIDYYITENGKAPFMEWINSLDMQNQIIVDRYIQRVAQGGAYKSIRKLKGGIFEIKIPYAGGLRVYFAEKGRNFILLLVGGDKGTQNRDIKKAHKYWREYGKQK